MDIVSVLGMIVLGIIILISGLGTVYAIIRNYRIGRLFRRKLANFIVNHMRLGRMLDTLGIDKNRYLHDEQVTHIEQHMRRCRTCASLEACDDFLTEADQAEGGLDPAQPFCPNRDALLAIRNDQAAGTRAA